jgi:ubiquinone/menaquinone biosynthesis C-methylase UbiE
MAEKVGPNGRVLANEIDPQRLEEISRLAQSTGLANVTVVRGGERDTALPAECCDAIIMRGVYHHLTDPKHIDASLYCALKPGGELAILDFRPTWLLAPWTPKGIPANRGGHGVPPTIVVDEVTAAGFKLEQTVDPWPGISVLSNYCRVVPQAGCSSHDRSSVSWLRQSGREEGREVGTASRCPC